MSDLVNPDQIESIRAALAAKVERVRALHQPDPSGEWCDCCWTGPDSHGNGNSPEWPCPTIRALDEEPQPASTSCASPPHSSSPKGRTDEQDPIH